MSEHDRVSSTQEHHFTNKIVKIFLNSHLSLILILLATILGFAALWLTPREEDPQIVVPLADIYVNFPGHSAAEVEQLIATPLERMLYQIDGVEYVYSMSREGQAIITVRYYVGEDRERSLVKLYKKIDENLDAVPSGVTGWVVKPVEIDDVPIATLTLASRSADGMKLRRVAEELAQRLAGIQEVSDGRISRLAVGVAAGGPSHERPADGWRSSNRRPLDPCRCRRTFQGCAPIARSGRRDIRRAASVSQGCGPGRGRARRNHELCTARMGTSAWIHGGRALPWINPRQVGA
jgi:AcrB/AcrD/AcrF family